MEEDEAGHTVEISVRYGVVSLTGLVESYARKCAIDRAVGRIVGVKDLRDYLHVRPSDVRHHTHVGLCDLGQRADFARMIHPHFEDRDARLIVDA